MDIGSSPRRIYALTRLSYFAEIFKVDQVTSVPYQSVCRLIFLISLSCKYSIFEHMQTSSSGAPEHPRIQLIQNGTLISVQFGDAVALCARGP